ncbi:MAG TPA: hypothetical protein VGB08_03085 [Allosphingosinicella sp.]|jgi:hypothetical protein
MIRHSLGLAAAASILALQAGASLAQNTATETPATTPPATTPPATTTPPPATSTPDPGPRTADPAPRTSPEVIPVPVVVPQQTMPSTVELPETPYPNGFADPNAPFGNDMSVQVRQQNDGFDWGLLGLLGLFGLFGLYRGRDRHRHVVHSERYADDRRYDDGRPPRV